MTPASICECTTHLIVHSSYHRSHCGQSLSPEHGVAHLQVLQQLLTGQPTPQGGGQVKKRTPPSPSHHVPSTPGRKHASCCELCDDGEEVPHSLVVGLALQVAHVLLQVHCLLVLQQHPHMQHFTSHHTALNTHMHLCVRTRLAQPHTAPHETQ